MDRGRNERQTQRLVQGGDTGLIGKMSAWGDPCPLGENDDWPTLGGDRSGCRYHVAQGAGAGLAVDRNRAGARRVPAIKWNEQQLALQNAGRVSEDDGENEGVPCGLMLHRDDAAIARNAIEPTDLVIEADDDAEQDEDAARPKPAEFHRRRPRGE